MKFQSKEEVSRYLIRTMLMTKEEFEELMKAILDAEYFDGSDENVDRVIFVTDRGRNCEFRLSVV